MSWDYLATSFLGRQDACSVCGNPLLDIEEQERGLCSLCWEDELNEEEDYAETEDYWEEE